MHTAGTRAQSIVGCKRVDTFDGSYVQFGSLFKATFLTELAPDCWRPWGKALHWAFHDAPHPLVAHRATPHHTGTCSGMHSCTPTPKISSADNHNGEMTLDRYVPFFKHVSWSLLLLSEKETAVVGEILMIIAQSILNLQN